MEKNKIKKLEKQGIAVHSFDPGEWVVAVDETSKAKVETFDFLNELPNVVSLAFFDSFPVTDMLLSCCIGFCPKLRALDIGNGRHLSIAGIGEISKLKHLLMLTIHHNGFALIELFKASINKGLIDLDLRDTTLNDSMIRTLVEAFPKLKRLGAEYTKLGPKGIKELATLKKLTGLKLDGCKLNDTCFDSLIALKQIKLVSLLYTKVTQPAAEEFAKKKSKCLVTIGDMFDMILLNEDKWDEEKYVSLFRT